MTIIEYNLKQLILSVILCLGTIWIFSNFIKKQAKPIIKIVLTVIMTLLIIAFALYALLSLVYKEQIMSGTVHDVIVYGSWGGFLDEYSIELITHNGESIWVRTNLVASHRFKQTLEGLQIGDSVTFLGGGYFSIIYNVILD